MISNNHNFPFWVWAPFLESMDYKYWREPALSKVLEVREMKLRWSTTRATIMSTWSWVGLSCHCLNKVESHLEDKRYFWGTNRHLSSPLMSWGTNCSSAIEEKIVFLWVTTDYVCWDVIVQGVNLVGHNKNETNTAMLLIKRGPKY